MCKIEVCFLLPSRVVRVLYMIYEKMLTSNEVLSKSIYSNSFHN